MLIPRAQWSRDAVSFLRPHAISLQIQSEGEWKCLEKECRPKQPTKVLKQVRECVGCYNIPICVHLPVKVGEAIQSKHEDTSYTHSTLLLLPCTHNCDCHYNSSLCPHWSSASIQLFLLCCVISSWVHYQYCTAVSQEKPQGCSSGSDVVCLADRTHPGLP